MISGLTTCNYHFRLKSHLDHGPGAELAPGGTKWLNQPLLAAIYIRISEIKLSEVGVFRQLLRKRGGRSFGINNSAYQACDLKKPIKREEVIFYFTFFYLCPIG